MRSRPEIVQLGFKHFSHESVGLVSFKQRKPEVVGRGILTYDWSRITRGISAFSTGRTVLLRGCKTLTGNGQPASTHKQTGLMGLCPAPEFIDISPVQVLILVIILGFIYVHIYEVWAGGGDGEDEGWWRGPRRGD